MTELTRRDALFLTAAATTASAALQTTAAAQPAPPAIQKTEDATILEVPAGVTDGSSIPITIRLPAKDIALKTGDSLTGVSVKLSLQKDPKDDANNTQDVFSASLTDTALPTDTKADIIMMTHLKMAYDPFKPLPPPPPQDTSPPPPPQFKANLFATIDIKYKTANEAQFTAHQSVTILPQDCASSNVAVLRLGLPPSVSKGAAMLVRAILPATRLPYLLKKITCTKPDDANPANVVIPFDMEIMQQNVYVRQPNGAYAQQNGVYISDEVFVSFNLYPNKDGLITMTWDYHDQNEADATKKIDLSASSYFVIS
jgi:hypothetical protein